VVAYECLTGRRPFEASSVGELMRRVLADVPPTPASSLAPVPAAFDDWFRVACARDPRDRFADVQTAALALAAALDPVAAPLVEVETEPREAASRGGAGQHPAGDSPEAPAEAPRVESALEAVPTLASSHEEDAAPSRRVSPLASTIDSSPDLAAPVLPEDPGEAPPSSPVSRRGAPRSSRGEPLPRFGIARTAMGALAASALALTLAIHDAPRPTAGRDARIAAARIPADRPPTSATHPASASFSLADPTALGGAPAALAAVHPPVASYAEPSEPAQLSSMPPVEPSIDERDSLLASFPPPETVVSVPPQQPSALPSPSSGAPAAPPPRNVRARASAARSSAFALGPLGL
jgi:serine/threonine-protein kinase